jgi:hypothetical protein
MPPVNISIFVSSHRTKKAAGTMPTRRRLRAPYDKKEKAQAAIA